MFRLDQVVPWGRSFDEYRRMFDLTESDLQRRILGCGDGPASFNAEATRRGAHVVSVDPIYRFTATEIEERIAKTHGQVLEQTRQHADQFIWDTIESVETLGEVRMAAMRTFLADYPAGKAAGRYVDAALPALPFGDGAFDVALCSHLLFLYSAHLDEAFHHAAVRELCRVGSDVRIFPLLTLAAARSPHVDSTMDLLEKEGFTVSIETVQYEFQRGGNQMMRITRSRRGRRSHGAPIDIR